MSAVDSMVEIYVFENMQLLEQLEVTLLDNEKQAALSKAQIDEIFRVMHTIKGSSAMMGYDGLAKLSHKIEDIFAVLRQREDIPKQAWALIFDLVLECIDFFKVEITKVQDGLLPDGSHEPLIARAIELDGFIANPPKEEEAPHVEPPAQIIMPDDPKPEKIAPAVQAPQKATQAQHYYMAQIHFEPGCSMESVRAFAVVNSLEGMYEKIAHEPEDLGVNCDEEIIANGLTLYIASNVYGEELEKKLGETMFLQRMELIECDISAMPPSISGELPSAVVQPKKEEPEQTQSAGIEEQYPPVIKQQEETAPAEQKREANRGSGGVQNFLSVNVGKVDKLMDLVGEIVTTESMVTKHPDIVELKLESFDKQSRRLRQLTDELQDIVMSIRMVPISSTFRKMQRLVRDMARKTGKEVELVLLGEQTEVDKNVIEHLSDPLMHMIRNSMDHGLETPQERLAAGKAPAGTITLEARNTGGDVLIIISDDGRGLDRDKLIKKAQEKGLTTKSEADISDREAYRFIMQPGFSTRDAVTEFSGRGVGMDVVCSNVERMGGSVSVDSELGCGTSFMLNIPLTLAIIDGMEVKVGQEHYIIPILNMRESFEPRLYDIIIEPDGTESILIRGKCIRIERLHRLFDVEGAKTDFYDGIMVLIESEFGSTCLFVDKIVGEQQAVVKPLPLYLTRNMGRLAYISGCTILGNGSISLILDANHFTGVKPV
ncbi:chemotaxis protein CheA [Eubacteriales bacterium OttesenSCG-928-K08]|nr:chemotaxis protein CheA [Eubacteriales bacterium OttesenSCG-928-K08]